MKRLAITFVLFCAVLFCAPTMWGVALSTVAGASLDWKNASSWSPAQVPTNADTCTISSTTTLIQVTDAETCGSLTVNGTGASISTTLELVTGGTLSIDATNGQTGNIIQKLSTAIKIHGGQLIPITGASATTWAYGYVASGIPPVIEICSNATCSGVLATSLWPTAIAPNTTGGGSFGFTNAAAWSPSFTGHNVVLQNLGSATTYGWTIGSPNAGQYGMSVTYDHMLFRNSGVIALWTATPSTSPPVLQVNNVTVWNSIATTGGGGNGGLQINFGTAGAGAGSFVRNLYFFQPPGNNTVRQQFYYRMVGIQTGAYQGAPGDSSDIGGYYAYNASLNAGSTSGTGQSFRNSFQILNWSPASTANEWSADSDNGITFYYTGSWTKIVNNHHWFTSGSNVGGSPSVLDHTLCDGGDITMIDPGDFDFNNGTLTSSNNLLLDGCGCFDSGSGGPLAVDTRYNNTEYNNVYHDVGHAGFTDANGLNGFNGNIISNTFQASVISNFAQGSIYAGAANFVRQNIALGMNRNLFYAMANSGDPGAKTVVGINNVPNKSLGTNNSYVMPTAGIPITTGPVIATNSCPTGCAGQVLTTAGSFGAVQRGDWLYNPTTKYYDVITAATTSSITLQNGCGASVAPCVTNIAVSSSAWNIIPGFNANALIYGTDSGYGTDDYHFNANFFDPTRRPCTYATTVLGLAGIGTVGCPLAGTTSVAGELTISSSSGITDIVCSGCTTNWGISTSDSLVVVTAGGSQRCAAAVASVVSQASPLHITITGAGGTGGGCTGLTATDKFWFITDQDNLAKYIMASSGWTFTGQPGSYAIVPTTPNGWTYRSMYEWVAAGFQPYAGQSCNTYNNTTVGLKTCYPAAIIGSN